MTNESATRTARLSLLAVLPALALGACALLAVHGSMKDASAHLEAARVEADAGRWTRADEEVARVEALFAGPAIADFNDEASYVELHGALMTDLERLRRSLQAGGDARTEEQFDRTTRACANCHDVYD